MDREGLEGCVPGVGKWDYLGEHGRVGPKVPISQLCDSDGSVWVGMLDKMLKERKIKGFEY